MGGPSVKKSERFRDKALDGWIRSQKCETFLLVGWWYQAHFSPWEKRLLAVQDQEQSKAKGKNTSRREKSVIRVLNDPLDGDGLSIRHWLNSKRKKTREGALIRIESYSSWICSQNIAHVCVCTYLCLSNPCGENSVMDIKLLSRKSGWKMVGICPSSL